MSAFFHSRQSSELLPEHAQNFNLKPASTKKRGILHERSQSDINRENGEQPTIRLVDSDSGSKNVYSKDPFPHMPSQVLHPPGSKHGFTIKDDGAEGPSSSHDFSLGDHLHPQDNAKKPFRQSSSPKRSNRLSNRLSTFSQSTTTSAADTLLNDSLFSPNSCRFSLDATLRNTPTPNMSEEREMERLQEESLTPVEEHSFESSTIRPVSASSPSDNSGSRGSDTTQKRDTSASHTPGPSGVTGLARPPMDVSSPSQYSSSPPEQPSGSSWNIIRYASSQESMASVQYPQYRPATAKSLSASSAWSTTNEDESLPPLSVARKRHMHSASAGAIRVSNLSTIASESEASSQTNTRSNTHSRLSESPSMDIFTSPPEIAPSSSQSGNWYVRRRTIAGSSSYSSLASMSQYQTLSTESSRWDLGRSDSAVPEPLFSSSPRVMGTNDSNMAISSPKSPIYELPGDAPSEQDDTIAELQAPPLRTKRSGYLSSRGRSQSDPRPASARSTHSLGAGDRTSQGSSIFPQWAKSFYRGGANLPNANGSTASLALSESQMSMRMMPWAYHRRWDSGGRSARGNNSPGNSGTPYSASPRSSHFLPSIFRPHGRNRTQMGQSQSTNTTSGTGSGTRSSSLAELYIDESALRYLESDTESSSDSMAISPVIERGMPPRRQRTVNSGRAIPREQTYSSSNYPQSLSASRMYTTPPHLAPSRRLSHRISAWRAPSFDEALNTLIFSRGNRQILFFCLGFLCPISWMIAAFLPLPLRPAEVTLDNLEASPHDLSDAHGEKSQFSLPPQVNLMDWQTERIYLKAKWWRNLNRIMSVVGVGIVAAIIALAVIATK